MSEKIMKIHSNYFYNLKLMCFAICLGIYPTFITTQYNFKVLDYKILIMILLMFVSILIIVYAILRFFLSYIIIGRNNIVIKTIVGKIIIPVKDIDSIQKEFTRGKNTSIFGKTTYEIRTISKTYKITSEQYMNLNKLDKYLNIQKENKG